MALTKVSGDFIKDGSITQGHLHSSHGITTSDVGEGSNLYFTTARVDSRIGDLSTSDLSEGTNLYYTDARVGSYLTTNSYATQSYVNTQVSNLVDSAPSTLDTLNELAAALGDDANFSTTITNSIATKMPLAGGTFTGQVNFSVAPFLTQGVDLVFKAASGSTDPGDLVWRDGSNNERHRVWDGTNTLNYRTAGGTSYQLIHSGYSSYNNSNWDTAYGWGNHASAGYLTSYTETDTLATVTGRGATTSTPIVITASGSANSASLQIDNPDSSSFNHSIEAFAANLTNGESNVILVGKEGNTKNSGYIGYYWTASGSNNNFVSLGHWAADHLFRVYGDQVLSTVTFRSNVDVQSPIFYDSNDTTYYIDPNSTGTSINVRGEISNPSVWINDGDNYNNYNENIRLFNAPNSVSVIAFSASGTSGTPTTSILGYANYLEFRRLSQWQQRLGTNYAEAYGDYRAPIFYDSNDTGYYVNPNTTSNLNTLQVADAIRTDRYEDISGNFMMRKGTNSGTTRHFNLADATSDPSDIASSHTPIGITWGQRGDNNPYYIIRCRPSYSNGYSTHSRLDLSWHTGVEIGAHPNYGGTRFFNNSSFTGSEIMRVGSGNSDVYINNIGTAGSSLRAPIFYDSDNTGYYIDPASTTVLNGLNTNSGDITATHFGIANTSNGSRDGIALYGSATGGEPTYGLLFTGTSLGTHGGVTGDWATYFTMNNDTNRGWIFRRVGTGNSASISAGGLATFDNSVRSPIFYDSNNTNYYTNPASTSVLNGLTVGGNTVQGFNGGWNASNMPGSRWNGYSINGGEIVFQRDNPSTGKMSVMVDGNFHAGENGAFWSLPSNSDYNGRRGFYQDTSGNLQIGTSTSENVLRTNYGYVQVGPMNSSHAHLYTDRTNFYFNKQIQLLGGTLINQNDVQSVIYYDRSDTGYYCDPNGTSNFSGLSVNAQISGSINGASNAVAITGYGNGNLTFQQTSGSFAGRSGWHNHIISNHGNGSNYYNTVISMDFWGAVYHSRLEGGTFRGPYMFCTAAAGFTSGQEINSSLRMKAAEFWDYNNTNYYAHLDATGYSIRIAGTVQSNYSDIQLKDVIENIPNALDKVNQLNGFYYYPNEIAQGYGYKKKKEVGLSAQEVEAVLPEIVDKAPVSDKYKTIQYERVVPLLVEAIKELKADNDSLRARIETLENQ